MGNALRERYWDGQAWGATRVSGDGGLPEPAPPAVPKRGIGFLGCLGLIVAAGATIAAISIAVSALTHGNASSSEVPQSNSAAQPPAEQKSAAQLHDETQVAAGWTVIESGSLYGKFADKADYTCGYGKCSYYLVYTVNGCPSALYVEASTLSGDVVVGMTDDLVSGVRAGETAAMHFQIIEDGADSVRISDVSCY